MAFESILLFSLAVLIIAVGLLVYYFKKRIAEVEQKTSKSLEIVHDLYMQQVKMKSDFNAIIQSLQEEDEPVSDNNIQFTFLNHELANTHNGGTYEEAEEVFDETRTELSTDGWLLEAGTERALSVQLGTEGATNTKLGTFGALSEPLDIKTVNVDMTLPDEELIEITNDDEPLDEPEEDDEPEQPELLEEDHIVVEKIGSEEPQPQTVSKEDLKKMTPSTLKSLIISKGVSAEAVHKLKKNELIDVLLKL